MIEGFKTTKPKPEPIHHSRSFTEGEIISALTLYMERNGIEVPKGKVLLYGLMDDYPRTKMLTLRIDEEVE